MSPVRSEVYSGAAQRHRHDVSSTSPQHVFLLASRLIVLGFLSLYASQIEAQTHAGNVNRTGADNRDNSSISFTAADMILVGTNNTETSDTPFSLNIASPISLTRAMLSSGAGRFFLGRNAIQFNGPDNTLMQSLGSAKSITKDIQIDHASNNHAYMIMLVGDETGRVALDGVISRRVWIRDYAFTKTANSSVAFSMANTYGDRATVKAAARSFYASQIPDQIYTWTGNGGNVNWSTAGNWSGGAPVSDDLTDLIFAGTTNTGTAGTPLNQDIASPIYINSLTFSSGGGAFFLGGNNLRMQGASDTITQSSSSAESIANDFSAPNINSTFTISLTGDGTGVVTMGGVIPSGTGSKDYAIAKSGTSTFVLTGASTYGGGTTVNSGALYINNISGSGTGTGNVSVTGGTFGGSGKVSGAVTVASGANLSPGALGANSTAVFHTGNLSLNSGANFVLDLNNTTVGSGYDQASVTGTVNINGSTLILNPGGGLSIGDTFFILANDGVDAITGTFSQGATITSGNDTFAINYVANFGGGGAGNDISLTLIAVLPEASTWISGLVAGAIAIAHAIMVRTHRRRQSKQTVTDLRR